MSTEERAFAILGGHAMNTISVWVKLLKLSSVNPELGAPQIEANCVQSGLLGRVLAAAVVESKRWLERPGSMRIIEKYLPRLSQHIQDQYNLLNEVHSMQLKTKTDGPHMFLSTIQLQFSFSVR